jgi:hypothetical protein
MSSYPKLNLSQIRAAVLPDFIISIVGPVLIYRLAAPYMPATYALLLASVLPIIRIGISLVRYHRLNLIGVFSLLTIALKILIALVLKDARLVLVSDSLITAVYGVLMLASLLTASPLIMRLIESVLANTAPAQSQQLILRWHEPNSRLFFTVITAVWGIGLLLECVARVALALTVSVEQFLVISPIVRYGFLGGLLLWAILFARIHNRKQQKQRERVTKPNAHETSHSSVPR